MGGGIMAEKGNYILMTIKMPESFLDDLNNFVESHGGNRSEIVRNAITLYMQGGNSTTNTLQEIQQKIQEKTLEKQLRQIEKDISQLELNNALLKRKLNNIQNDIAQNLEDDVENTSKQL